MALLMKSGMANNAKRNKISPAISNLRFILFPLFEWGAAAPRVPLNNGARLVQLTIVHHAADRGGGVTH